MVKRKDIAENVLFLDFDGVCNSFECGSYLTTPTERYGHDPRIVKRIREICEMCGAGVVISSNWRRYPADGEFEFNGRKFRNPLTKLVPEIKDIVIGSLPADRHILKSAALVLWMEDHPGFYGKYAILDDDERERYQDNPVFRKNLWLVDRTYGITEKIKNEIMEHFSE